MSREPYAAAALRRIVALVVVLFWLLFIALCVES
jgi:hypothetical protein